MYDFKYNFKIIVVKNIKRLNISHNPVGQEEKQGKARFPLAVLSTAEQSTNTLPCGTAKARTRGTGRCRSEAQRKNLFHKQKNTSKRHNRLHKIKLKTKGLFRYMETKDYLCKIKKLYMEVKSRFNVILSNEAQEFLDGLPSKVREKIVSNIRKSTFVLDPELFKKLDDTDIWEFRTFYNKTKYRLLAFWDKDDKINTLVIATHGFIKKTQKTPPKEIAKAEEIRKDYFNSKR